MNREKKNNNKKSRRVNFILICIIVTILSVTSIVIFMLYSHTLEAQQYNRIPNDKQNYVYNYDASKHTVKAIEVSEKIVRLQELQKINSDIVALIEIEGTNIKYPVLQTDNNSYYMTHNYKKEKSKDGAIFLDKDYSWEMPSTNLLIYGHNNIGSTEMFAELTKYKKESFYKKHKIINFVTSVEEAQYEIISVFLSKVYYKHETNVFRYYYFLNANSKQEFDEYINNCKKLSLYEINLTAEYGDSLMTLSTCEYSKLNGRLAIVAKKISN